MAGRVANSYQKKQKELDSDKLQIQSQFSVYDDNIQSAPKKTLHPVVLILNVLWMLAFCYASLFYIYGSIQPAVRLQKGYTACTILGYTVVVALPTFFYLVNWKQLLRLLFLLDSIMVVTIAAGLAFINLILIFDTTDDWYWSIIEAGFAIQVAFYSTMVRVFLVHLKWPKWQIIFFKFSIMANAMMFFISGVYFILVNFTYTRHRFPKFDGKVHDFMVLFIFSMFAYGYELYNKVTDLDGTGDLRYIYQIKNVDQNFDKKKKSVIKNKRQSLQSLTKLINADQLDPKLYKTKEHKNLLKFKQFKMEFQIDHIFYLIIFFIIFYHHYFEYLNIFFFQIYYFKIIQQQNNKTVNLRQIYSLKKVDQKT